MCGRAALETPAQRLEQNIDRLEPGPEGVPTLGEIAVHPVDRALSIQMQVTGDLRAVKETPRALGQRLAIRSEEFLPRRIDANRHDLGCIQASEEEHRRRIRTDLTGRLRLKSERTHLA